MKYVGLVSDIVNQLYREKRLTTEFCTEMVTLFLLEMTLMLMLLSLALSTCNFSWLDLTLTRLLESRPLTGRSESKQVHQLKYSN